MQELVNIIINCVSIWMPSVAAILGIVTTTLLAISKFKAAIDDLKESDVLKTLSEDLKKSLRDNKELKEQNDILIDEIKKIKNYRENKNR